jgi:hypothetical protein
VGVSTPGFLKNMLDINAKGPRGHEANQVRLVEEANVNWRLDGITNRYKGITRPKEVKRKIIKVGTKSCIITVSASHFPLKSTQTVISLLLFPEVI